MCNTLDLSIGSSKISTLSDFENFARLEAVQLEAVKSVHCQILRILLALKQCSNEKDSKTSVHALGLFVAVCDFQFLLGLEVLKFIFSFTIPLATYLQGKEIDIETAQKLHLELLPL